MGDIFPDSVGEASWVWARQSWEGKQVGMALHRAGWVSGAAKGERGMGPDTVGAAVAAQRHTPFHAPWAVAGPTAISFQGWEGPGMRRGLPHPWFPAPSGLCGLRKWVPHTFGNGPRVPF